MAAKTMYAQKTSVCPATGRTITPGTLIFKSILGWAIFDSESFAAVRAAVAEGRTAPAPVANAARVPARAAYPRNADPDWLTRQMDREDSAF